MKICLINPPSPFLTNEKVFPSLGLLKIGAYLEQMKFGVKVLDLAGFKYWNKELHDFLKEESPKYVGITAVTPQIPIVFEMCKMIKEEFPSIKIIIGGPHVTMSYGSIKNGSNRSLDSFENLIKYVDNVVIGYGELAILKAFELDSPKIIDTESDKSLFINNEIYNILPMPARHLIDLESYSYQIDNNKSTSLISQLGCPFSCGFCGGRNSATYKKIRNRSADSVLKEIDFLYKTYGYTGFMFYDDEININKHLFEGLLKQLIDYQKENNVKFSFRGFSRSDLLSEDQAILMYEAGFRWLLLGFESGSNKILQSMNKKTSVDQNTRAFDIARKAKLKIKALMSVGHPGESLETIEETKNWLNLVRPDETDITIITLYPGSTYFDNSVFEKNRWVYTAGNGEILFSKDINYLTNSLFYKSKPEEYSCFVSTPYLSSENLIKNRNELEKITKQYPNKEIN